MTPALRAISMRHTRKKARLAVTVAAPIQLCRLIRASHVLLIGQFIIMSWQAPCAPAQPSHHFRKQHTCLNWRHSRACSSHCLSNCSAHILDSCLPRVSFKRAIAEIGVRLKGRRQTSPRQFNAGASGTLSEVATYLLS